MTNPVVMSIPITQTVVWKNFSHWRKARFFKRMADFKSGNIQDEEAIENWNSQIKGDPTG